MRYDINHQNRFVKNILTGEVMKVLAHFDDPVIVLANPNNKKERAVFGADTNVSRQWEFIN